MFNNLKDESSLNMIINMMKTTQFPLQNNNNNVPNFLENKIYKSEVLDNNDVSNIINDPFIGAINNMLNQNNINTYGVNNYNMYLNNLNCLEYLDGIKNMKKNE